MSVEEKLRRNFQANEFFFEVQTKILILFLRLNYESRAAAAGDLGGMQPCSRTAVVTIGLGTITYNPDAVILVCAAGEAKAKVVANAIQEPANVQYPCSALHACRNAVFFITKGAAKNLDERTL